MSEIKKIAGIKEELQAAEEGMLPAFILKYETDQRAGVQKLVMQAKKCLQALQQERQRIERLKVYEKQYENKGYVCGIDEAGRGPLAGPVVAGAVILPKDCNILYINDSKKLSAAKREELYGVIMEQAVAVGVGIVGPARIDEINILQATYEAMRQAIQNLSVTPDILLNDAVTIPQVTRDRLMIEYDKVMPEYGFAKNKGYGSKAHMEAVREHGASLIHRQSFIKNIH